MPTDTLGAASTLRPIAVAKDTVARDIVDLGLRLRARTELGGDWLRFRPCDPSVRFTCEPSLVPRLRPDVQFGIQLAGTVSDRIRVDVDYDQTREFAGANRIRIDYSGGPGEFLRGVQVGDVNLDLPPSRLLQGGVPAGNFGVRAVGEVGSLELQTIVAQQRGDLSSRSFQLATAGGIPGFVQEDTLVVDDADYVRGQFFFVADPGRWAGWPHLDILSLASGDAPPEERPGREPIQLYRFSTDPVTRQQVEGYIQATATASGAGGSVAEAGWFRFLQPGVDYFTHPSGLWVALRTPLRPDEMLAVTYITAAGDTVGDYNPERLHNRGVRPRLRLLRATSGNHRPGRPTWATEMHQVYRVSASNDVEAASVELSISLGELSAGRTFKRAPDGREVSFLKLFGVDEEAPFDRLDRPALFRPADESLEDPPAVSGTFLVFPTLRPFQRPPRIPSLGLTEADAQAILGADRNDRIYDDPDPVQRANGGLFRLTLPFRVRSEGVISSFSLGAIGIREGSERILLGDRVLVPGQDYLLDAGVGLVTLLEAEALFAANPGAVLRARWEQQPLFQRAPTVVAGVGARTRFGDRGGVHFLGLYQGEQALVNRPTLGVEPGAHLLASLGGEVRLDTPAVDRALAAFPGSGIGELRLRGEGALTVPDPNTRGDVFLDDFDGSSDLAVSLLARNWRLGSAPAPGSEGGRVLPLRLDASDVERLVWQHSWILESPSGDSTGVADGLFPEQIDRQINVVGSAAREPVLLLSFGERRVPGTPIAPPGELRWRSITTPLSPTGLDLSRSEYLEFYAAAGDSLTLVLDLGRVSEDALFVDERGNSSGTRPDGRPWGLGVLDQEADPRLGEIWGDRADALGLWGETCRSTAGAVYRAGDVRANCTRGNGRPDSEDLDGNGNLDLEERFLRFVVRLDGSSPFLVRERAQTGTGFRLYRIPLRDPATPGEGSAFADADYRAVKHLRMTVVGRQAGAPLLARMRITGSRWVKRGTEGVVQGIAGDRPGSGRLEVTSVSRISEGAAYRPPPGVLEQLDDPSGAIGGRGVEYNERSLGLRYEELGGGDRAEVYSRFPQRPRNFLAYREARFWVLARRGEWGEGRPLTVFLKVGTDDEHFYLYRKTLEPAEDSGGGDGVEWLPEVVVDFQPWLDLRARAEERLLLEPPGVGGPPLAVWSADSTYAVVLRDRARAPSLASVRELSLGVWNEGAFPTSGEVWLNELRLGDGVRDPGFAGVVEMDWEMGGFVSSRLTMNGRSPFFRELRGDASYLDDRDLALSTVIQAGELLPSGWGVELPVVVSWGRSTQAPAFLDRSDVLAGALTGLRPTGSDRARISVSVRRTTPAEHPWVGLVVDGLEGRVGYGGATLGTVTSSGSSRSVDAGLAYRRAPELRSLPLLPGWVRRVLAPLLPDGVEQGLMAARLRWTPERVNLSASYLGQENRVIRFDQILVRPGEDTLRATRSPREGVEALAEIAFRPVRALGAEVALVSDRDLLRPSDATTDPLVQAALREERSRWGGVDVGWETGRTVRTGLTFEPRLAPWLRTEAGWNTRYLSDRSAGYLKRTEVEGDTLLELPRNLSAERTLRGRLGVEPAVLARRWGGVPGGIGERLLPITLSGQQGVNARFNRAVVDPGSDYQLGIIAGEDFRFIARDTASLLADRSAWAGGGGVRLPLGATLTGEFNRSVVRTLDARGERELRARGWPVVRLAVAELPLPAALRPVLPRISASSGFVLQRTESVVGEGGQLRSREDRVIPLSLTLRWTQVGSLTWSSSLQDGEGRDPTGDTGRSRRTHAVALASFFRPPAAWAGELDRPVQLTLRLAYADQIDCRSTAAGSGCVPYVDQLTRDFSLVVDTAVSGIDLGVRTSWFDRVSFIGQRSGSTQFQLAVFAQLNVAAGNPLAFGPPFR